MATHSSVLAWRIPGMAEPGGLPSMGSHRVGHDRSDLAAAAAVVHMVSLISFLWLWFDYVDHNKLLKILKEMGIPDHLTNLLKNLYAGQEATVRTGHGTTDWFQIGEGEHQGCILSPCLFNFYAEYSMRNTVLDEAQAESRLPGEISITSDIQMTPPLWQKAKKN